MYKFSTSVKGHNYGPKLHCFKRLSDEPVRYSVRRGGNIQDEEGGDPEGAEASEGHDPLEGGAGDTPHHSSSTPPAQESVYKLEITLPLYINHHC